MTKSESFIKEFVHRLSNDDLAFLFSRLNQRLGGDVAEAVQFLSTHRSMDTLLQSADNWVDFHNMIESITQFVSKENEKRHV